MFKLELKTCAMCQELKLCGDYDFFKKDSISICYECATKGDC